MKVFHKLPCAAALFLLALSVQAQSSRGLPPGGASSVSLYGIAATELVQVTNVREGANLGSTTRLENSKVTASRLGFIGSEDLGGGISAVFNLEMGYSLDTGNPSNATTFFNRSSYVGLRGGFGTLTLGRHWDVEDDILGRYFVFAGYSAFQFSEFGGISETIPNSVKYVSPNWGGVTLRGLYALGEGTTGHSSEIAANYAAGGPFEAGATWRVQHDAQGRATQLATVGASYLFQPGVTGSWRLHGGYAASMPDASIGVPKAAAYDIGLVWTPPKLPMNLTLDYVARDQKGTPNDSSFVRLGAEYFLSKRTALIANLVRMRNEGTASQRFYGLGAAGYDQNVYSVGLRHAF